MVNANPGIHTIDAGYFRPGLARDAEYETELEARLGSRSCPPSMSA